MTISIKWAGSERYLNLVVGPPGYGPERALFDEGYIDAPTIEAMNAYLVSQGGTAGAAAGATAGATAGAAAAQPFADAAEESAQLSTEQSALAQAAATTSAEQSALAEQAADDAAAQRTLSQGDAALAAAQRALADTAAATATQQRGLAEDAAATAANQRGFAEAAATTSIAERALAEAAAATATTQNEQAQSAAYLADLQRALAQGFAETSDERATDAETARDQAELAAQFWATGGKIYRALGDVPGSIAEGGVVGIFGTGDSSVDLYIKEAGVLNYGASYASPASIAGKLPVDGSLPMSNDLPMGNNSIKELLSILLDLGVIGEDGYFHLFKSITQDGRRLAAFAYSIITSQIDIGSLSQGTNDRNALKVFLNQAKVLIGQTVVGEDQKLRLVDLRNADGDQLDTWAVDIATGRGRAPLLDDYSYTHIAAEVETRLPPSGGVVMGAAVASDQPIDYFGIWNQSDDTGEGAAPAGQQAIMTPLVWPDYGLMLGGPGGLRGPMDDTINRALITDFVPAKDERYPRADLVLGQVPAFGMLTMADRLNVQSGTPRYSVARACGRGGLRLDQLLRGSTYYTNALNDFEKAKLNAAEKYNQMLRFFAFLGQGVADRQIGTSEAAWMTTAATLLSQIRENFTGLHPDAPIIRMTLDQIAPRTDVTQSWDIATAQYKLMRDNADFILSGPSYFMTMSDPVHLDPVSRWLRGEYRKRASHFGSLPGGSFKPSRPTNIVRTGNKITLKITTPFGHSIVRDTSGGVIANDGFLYSGANITSSVITDAAQGLMELTLDAAAPGELSGGLNFIGRGSTLPGAWMTIRDTDPTPSTLFPDKLLHNWLVQFKETVA